MALPTRRVAGTLYGPGGSPLAGAVITLRLSQQARANDGSGNQIISGVVTVTANASGFVDFSVVPNDQTDVIDGFYLAKITPVDGSTPWEEHWQILAGAGTLALGDVSVLL